MTVEEARKFVDSLVAWSMNDDEWRAAGCPTPGSLYFAEAAARRMCDGGRTYIKLQKALKVLEEDA